MYEKPTGIQYTHKGIDLTDEEKRKRVDNLYPDTGELNRKDPNWKKKIKNKLAKYGLRGNGESPSSSQPNSPQEKQKKNIFEITTKPQSAALKRTHKKENDTGKIQNLELEGVEKPKNGADISPKMRKKFSTENELNGQKKIQTIGENKMNAEQEIEKNTTEKNTPDENAVTPFTASTELCLDTRKELSHSTSLLGNTENHLYGLMRSLTANQPPAELKAVDPETVKAACFCADQIYKIGRLRLDAFRLAKELENK